MSQKLDKYKQRVKELSANNDELLEENNHLCSIINSGEGGRGKTDARSVAHRANQRDIKIKSMNERRQVQRQNMRQGLVQDVEMYDGKDVLEEVCDHARFCLKIVC
jgi:hypothetical protein